MGFSVGMLWKKIFNADVKGTANIIPTIPHIYPQKINEIKIIMGDKLRLFPVIFGSIAFPMINCVNMRPAITNTTRREKPNFKIPIITGNAVAIMEPKLGIKFNTKINNAEKITKSKLPINRMMPHKTPVKTLINVLINR